MVVLALPGEDFPANPLSLLPQDDHEEADDVCIKVQSGQFKATHTASNTNRNKAMQSPHCKQC